MQLFLKASQDKKFVCEEADMYKRLAVCSSTSMDTNEDHNLFVVLIINWMNHIAYQLIYHISFELM